METGPLVWWKSFFVTPYRRSCKGLAPTKHFISGQSHFGHNCFWGRFMGRRARIPLWWRRLITVCVLIWPPNSKSPRSAPAVLNDRCRACLYMRRSSLCVVLRGLPARSTGLMKVVFCYALPTVVQGFGANETLHFRTTTIWAQLLLGVGCTEGPLPRPSGYELVLFSVSFCEVYLHMDGQ
jgi:hypothetical protein